MAVGFSNTNKPLNPRGQDASPKGYNRAKLYSGKALSFDGVNDYVDLDGFTMAGTSATFLFTAKWDSISALNYIFDLDPQRLVLGSQLGTEISIYDNVSWKKFADWDDTTNTNVYALTIDGTTAKLYLNGQSFGNTLTLGTTIDLSAVTDFAIGSNQAKTSYFFNGQIAGFKIFNTALTAAQVADLYNNPEKVVPTGVDNTALKLWLPMMEGAGTTAYDGSGNGNHGTIAGATYVNGIGAPVAQSAVMDWNKNKNSITNSADFSAAAGWSSLISGTGTAVVTNNYAESPYGGQTAARLQAAKNTGYGVMSFTPAVSTSGTYVSSIWAKSNTGSTQNVAMYSRNSASQYQSVTTEWTRIEFTGSAASNYFNIGALSASDASIDILLWGAQMVLDASEAGPYIPTIGTAQTTEVLLPQGLTTGRDITGVNLFENVRKQGALNLDGNSWAEVHDNASLDVSDEVTLECWLYHTDTTKLEHIIGKRASSGSWLRIYSASTNTLKVERDGGVATSNVSITENAWSHIVATIDTSDVVRFYVNGTQQTSKLNFTPWGMDNEAPVSIGAWVNENGAVSSNSYESGQIAQPRIYNRALTAAEVLQNYNSGKNTYK